MDVQDPNARLASSRRILILGPSGSGKTTLARQLGSLLGIEPIHLDAHFWKPGWIATAQPEWRATVSSLIQKEAWIMDGTYESTLDLRIPAADCIVLVESPRWACLWRVFKRKATVDDQRRPDAPAGQKIDLAFLSYIWRYPVVTHPFVIDCLQRYGPEKATVQLRGSSEIQSCLRQVESARGARRGTAQR